MLSEMTMPRAIAGQAALALLSCLLCALSTRAHAAADVEARADLLFASDLGGDFYGQRCDETAPNPHRGLGALASAISAFKAQNPAALVIGGGGILGPGGGARFLLHSMAGSQVAAKLVHDTGIELLTPGVQEFELARETLLGYFEALRHDGVVTLLSNVDCAPGAPALCRELVAQHVITRGGLRIGLFAVIPEDAPQRVGPGHLHGARVAPWKSLVAAAKKLRAEVDALVLEIDSSNRFGIDEALAFVRELDAHGAHADVIHLTRLDNSSGGVLSIALSNGALLVGTPAGGAGVTHVTLEKRAAGGSASAQRPRLSISAERFAAKDPAPQPSALFAKLEHERQRMCQGWEVSVATLPSAGLDRAAMTRLVLTAMRSLAHAEIALINSGAIADGGLPLRTATVHSVGNALPYKAQVVAFALTGKEISEALQKYLSQDSQHKLRIEGLSKKGDSLLVNGRPLSATEHYRIVTIDFVAAGGNGLLPDTLLSASRSRVVFDDLRHLVIQFLRQRGTKEDVVAPLPLEQRPLFRALVDVGLDVQNVTVSNPDSRYDRPQLSRQSSLAFKFDATVRGEMDQPRHLVQLSLRTLYGQSWLRTAPTPNEATWIGQETADLISLLGLYSYRGFSAQKPRLPTPYVSLGLESEFNRPDTRTYQHFELSSAIGLRVALPASISANLGIGVRSELLANKDSNIDTERDLARARFLLTTTLEMPKRALWPRLGSALLGEFSLNYNFTDPVLLRSHELRGIGKLYVELGRPLYLTVGTELYVYRDRDNSAGVALDITAGLKVVLNGHRQQF